MRSGPAFFVLALTVAPALAEPFQNTYYCVGEAAGGLIYDTALKRWRGTNFRTEEKFVLKFSKSGEHFEPSWINKDGQQTVFEYDVTLTKSGSNDFSTYFMLTM